MATLTRLPNLDIPDLPSELLGESDLFEELHRTFKYLPMPGTPTTLHKRDRALRQALQAAGARPFDPASVRRYKARQAWKMKWRGGWGRNLGLVACAALLLGGVWIIALANWKAPTPLNLLGLAMTVGGLFGTIATAITDRRAWRWTYHTLSAYHAPIPVEALRLALAIHKAAPQGVEVGVEVLEENAAVTRRADPFLTVRFGSEAVYHVAVWDEPSFSANLTA